jgi:hypothetical protein
LFRSAVEVTDIFSEVDEQLRSARFRAIAVKGWPFFAILVVALLLAVGGAYGWRKYQNDATGKASERYAAGVEALQRHDPAAAEKQFGGLTNGPRGYRALALMEEAGIRLEQKDYRGAATLLDQAAGAAPNEMTADAARLQAAYALMDAGAFGDARNRLGPLAASGRPFRIMAREALGMAALAAGDVAEAKGDLQVVTLSPDASDSARNRAGAALALIQTGGWTAAPQLAKAAAGLTPQAPVAPASPQAGAAGGAS